MPATRLPLMLLALAASALLSGCDLDGRFVVNADDTVTVNAQTWERGQRSWVQDGKTVTYTPTPCAAAQRLAPGLTTEETVDPTDDSRVGCKVTGRVPLAELARTGTVARLDDRIVVLVGLAHMQELQITSHVTLPLKQSSRIEITFPGPVVAHSMAGVAEGNTVVWADATKSAWEPLEAVAMAGGAVPDAVAVPGIAGVATLVGAGAGVGLWRLVRRRSADEDSDEGETS